MVTVVIRNPDWFLNADITFSAISILVSFVVAVVAFRAWYMTRKTRFFGLCVAFLALAFAFFTRMMANIIQDPLIFYFGYGLHILATIFAFLTLFIIANRLSNPRVVILFYLLVFPLFFFSASRFMSFYISTTIITGMIALTYFQNLWKIKERKLSAVCVFVAFLMFFLAHLQFLLSSMDHIFYISASVTQLAGFVLFLLTIIKVLKS